MKQIRQGKKRLKVYIPMNKFQNWKIYLEENYPYSEFHFNFSRWFRSCLQKIPKKDIIPWYPVISSYNEIKTNSKKQKIEKTIWIPEEMKKAIEIAKGILSINSYLLLILDLNVYGGATENQRIFQILNLQKRIDELDKKLYSLTDKAYTQGITKN